MTFAFPLAGFDGHAAIPTLDFAHIGANWREAADIRRFFESAEAASADPRSPQMRQRFNDRLLAQTGLRYLVSQYMEDRSSMLKNSDIMQEGRMLHLGVDIFARELETVYSPCNGRVVLAGNEPEDHSFGYYVCIQPDGKERDSPYIFLGHLSHTLPTEGSRVKKGQAIGALGDYIGHENGGWSRHLHLQMLRELPQTARGRVGYASREAAEKARDMYPDPAMYFPQLDGLPRVETLWD